MLNDTNRLLSFSPAPNGGSAGQNVVGSGAFVVSGTGPMSTVPVPASLTFVPLGLAAFAIARRRKHKTLRERQSEA